MSVRARGIHPQLLADCHHLGRLAACELLLHRNDSLPWFILVPDTDLADILDLPAPRREAVLTDCAAVSRFIKQVLGYPKVNFAGLGNVVPQMHLHVLGRREGDACWPAPVWGNLPSGTGYSAARLREWRDDLVRIAGLVSVERDIGMGEDA
jgi:diadenosine tetraphosphate (Ap4A) HIT family hydrolase